MTLQEKIIALKNHGISLSYLAEQTEIVPATLTKWIRNEKGLSKKNKEHLELTLQRFLKEIQVIIVGDNDDWNL